MVSGYTKGKGEKRKFIPFSNYGSGEIIIPEVKSKNKIQKNSATQKYNFQEKMKYFDKLAKTSTEIPNQTKKPLVYKIIEKKERDFQREEFLKKVETGVKSTVFTISYFDPHFQGLCLTYQFAKFGYSFIKKFLAYYRITNSWEQSLINTVDDEIKEKISILLKDNKLQNTLEKITNHLYDKFRPQIPVQFDTKYEQIMKRSMIQSINNSLFSNSSPKDIVQRELVNEMLEIYVGDMFSKQSFTATKSIISKKYKKLLSEKISYDMSDGIINLDFCMENNFDGTSWLEKNVPTIIEQALK